MKVPYLFVRVALNKFCWGICVYWILTQCRCVYIYIYVHLCICTWLLDLWKTKMKETAGFLLQRNIKWNLVVPRISYISQTGLDGDVEPLISHIDWFIDLIALSNNFDLLKNESTLPCRFPKLYTCHTLKRFLSLRDVLQNL